MLSGSVHAHTYVGVWWKQTPRQRSLLPLPLTALLATQLQEDLWGVLTVELHSDKQDTSCLAMNSCNRHYIAAPFPANGLAHASDAKVLLGRGSLANENSKAIFVFDRRI